MPNTASIHPDGFIEILLDGDQTSDSFKEIYEDSLPLIRKIQAENRPVLALIDLSKEGNFSLSSNKAAMEILETAEYDRLAMCCAPIKEIPQMIIMAMGKSDQTKLFDTRQEALAWLLQPAQ